MVNLTPRCIIDSEYHLNTKHYTIKCSFFATECTEPFQNENRQGKDRGQETVNEGVND